MLDGISSKKLWFSVGSVATLFAFPIIASHIPTMAPMYDAYVGGVIALAGLYLTGNIANKYVAVKALGPAKEVSAEDEK